MNNTQTTPNGRKTSPSPQPTPGSQETSSRKASTTTQYSNRVVLATRELPPSVFFRCGQSPDLREAARRNLEETRKRFELAVGHEFNCNAIEKSDDTALPKTKFDFMGKCAQGFLIYQFISELKKISDRNISNDIKEKFNEFIKEYNQPLNKSYQTLYLSTENNITPHDKCGRLNEHLKGILKKLKNMSGPEFSSIKKIGESLKSMDIKIDQDILNFIEKKDDIVNKPTYKDDLIEIIHKIFLTSTRGSNITENGKLRKEIEEMGFVGKALIACLGTRSYLFNSVHSRRFLPDSAYVLFQMLGLNIDDFNIKQEISNLRIKIRSSIKEESTRKIETIQEKPIDEKEKKNEIRDVIEEENIEINRAKHKLFLLEEMQERWVGDRFKISRYLEKRNVLVSVENLRKKKSEKQFLQILKQVENVPVSHSIFIPEFNSNTHGSDISGSSIPYGLPRSTSTDSLYNPMPKPKEKSTEEQLTEEQLTEKQSTEKQLTEEQSTEKQLTEEPSTEKQSTEKQSTEEQSTPLFVPLTNAPQDMIRETIATTTTPMTKIMTSKVKRKFHDSSTPPKEPEQNIRKKKQTLGLPKFVQTPAKQNAETIFEKAGSDIKVNKMEDLIFYYNLTNQLYHITNWLDDFFGCLDNYFTSDDPSPHVDQQEDVEDESLNYLELEDHIHNSSFSFSEKLNSKTAEDPYDDEDLDNLKRFSNLVLKKFKMVIESENFMNFIKDNTNILIVLNNFKFPFNFNSTLEYENSIIHLLDSNTHNKIRLGPNEFCVRFVIMEQEYIEIPIDGFTINENNEPISLSLIYKNPSSSKTRRITINKNQLPEKTTFRNFLK